MLGLSRVNAYLIIIALVGASFWGWGEWQYHKGWAAGRAAMELDQRRAAEQVRERIRDADTGFGDADDDLDWLRLRTERMSRPPATP